MRKEKEDEKEKKEENLLKELCGTDSELYTLLSTCLYETPLVAISDKDLASLTAEAEKSGKFRPAMDKAIFEGSQNPEERERYIEVVRDLALKSVRAMEQEKETAEREGITGRIDYLVNRIEKRKLMSERAEDILNVATKFYKEKLVERGENVRREASEKDRKQAERDERRTAEEERAGREARKRERSKMGRKERKEAEKQDRKENVAAEGRKEARREKRRAAAEEEKKAREADKERREARREERRKK